MIQPTIGRVVWYWPRLRNPGTQSSQPQAAIVTWVHSDVLVNLVVFDANGRPSGRTSVELYQGQPDRPDGEYCEWMPYQVGQAKRELHPVG